MSFKTKFRVYSFGTNRMIENVGYHPSIIMNLAADPEQEDYKQGGPGSMIICPEFINYKLLQYSNWKDKNGTEIYEGDVLQCINADGELVTVVCELGQAIRMIGENEVEISGFYLKKLSDGKKTFPITKNYLGQHDLDILEIIGNIYQNLELFPHEKI